MSGTNFSKAKPIPSKVTTKKSAPTTTNFAKGIFTYKPNDTMDFDEIYLAQNARFDRIGEYKTRRGLTVHTAVIDLQESNTLNDPSTTINMEDGVGLGITLSGTTTLCQIGVKLAAATTADYGVVQMDIHDENDKIVASTSVYVGYTTLTNSWFHFKDGVKPPAGVRYYGKLHPQNNDGKKYKITAAQGTTTILRSIKYTAHTGHVSNMFEANIDGTIYLLFTFKDDYDDSMRLYRVNNTTGNSPTLTLIRTLPSGVEKVRFSQNLDKIRYADGKEGPRLIDPANNWSDTAIPTIDLKTGIDLNIKVSNILAGTQDNMIYFDADTTTQAVWTYPYGFTYAESANFYTSATLGQYKAGETTTTTITKSTLTAVSSTHLVSALAINDIILDDSGNYGSVQSISGNNVTVRSISHAAEPVNSYDKFDRDFRQNFPAIKTGDPLTAMFNLGGIVYFLTRRNKYYMFSQTADVWTQQASSAQHGTFSQESVITDLNYAYYACDDGIYRFDGSSEISLTQNTIQSTYDAIQHKESITLEMFNNRLYVFYSSTGTNNDSCLVFNINLGLWESFDTGLSVSATVARNTASNRFMCGSSVFGVLYRFESPGNNYHDAGAAIDFDLETAYLHFGTPSQLHRITKWRPEFATVSGDYTIKCGYALDFTDDVKYAFSINLKNQTILNEHYVWDNPRDYGNPVTPTKYTTIPQVNGQFRRCQIRYQHHAACEPVLFKSHTLQCETQRLR